MTTPTLLFSIVVPTWNTGAKIGETVNSLVNQDFPHFQYEIIVVDDGSTDDTLEYLKPFLNRIRIFQQQNSGAASARNRGIQHAKGEYIVCFDHDDILFPYALSVYKCAIDAFERPPVLLAQTTFFSTGEGIKVASAKPSSVECLRCKDFFGKTISTEVLNSIFILRKDRVLGAGGYSPEAASYDDHDLLFKLGNASPMVKIIHPVTVAYRFHDRNATRNPAFVAQGALALIGNERRGVYPGGGRRMLDRRGLIGSNVLWNCYCNFRRRKTPIHLRLAFVARLLLHARGMILAAFVRKACSHFYFQEARSLDCSNPESREQLGIADTNPKDRTENEARPSGLAPGWRRT